MDTDGDGRPDRLEAAARSSYATQGYPGCAQLSISVDADRDCQPDITDTDDDDDGIPDGEEDSDERRTAGETDPKRADSDDDGLCDGDERAYGTSPTNADSDRDGLSGGLEIRKRGGCATPFRNDWTRTGIPLAPGRLTFQDYLGALGPLDPTSLPADADGDGMTIPLDPDSDGDNMIDGLEDWTPNGIVDAGEGDPRLVDGDEDGIPDSVELQVFGKMSYETFIKEATRRLGTADMAAIKKLATYDPASVIKTNPASTDTDGDGLPDGADINPNGLTLPTVTLKLETLSMMDTIDFDPWYNYRIDPYFMFEIVTTFGTIHPETKNLPELPLGGPNDIADLSGLAMKLVTPAQDPSKTAAFAPGALVVTLSEDIAKLVRVPDADGNAVWDRVTVHVTLGDWDKNDGGAEGNALGRDASDVVDITPDEGTVSPVFEMAFRLTEFAAPLRGAASSFPPPAIPDGSADGHRNRFGQEDDARLMFHLENAVKADFLRNADTLRSPSGKILPPLGQEFGL